MLTYCEPEVAESPAAPSLKTGPSQADGLDLGPGRSDGTPRTAPSFPSGAPPSRAANPNSPQALQRAQMMNGYTPEDQGRFGETVLRQGQSGENVRALQQQLIDRGYNLGSKGADGKFGPRTAKALEKFQKDHPELPKQERGAATPDTVARLGQRARPTPADSVAAKAPSAAAEPTRRVYNFVGQAITASGQDLHIGPTISVGPRGQTVERDGVSVTPRRARPAREAEAEAEPAARRRSAQGSVEINLGPNDVLNASGNTVTVDGQTFNSLEPFIKRR
jgi:peptidoglycan hydrolase-like protein with peptidoglycan-binding domain